MTTSSTARLTRIVPVLGAASVLALVLAGCGGNVTPTETSGASGLDPASAADATGDVTVCGPTDSSGVWGATVDAFNSSQDAVTADYIELGSSADDQLQQINQRMQTESTQCDILRLDVVWTAQLASQGYLADMSAVIDDKLDALIPSTAETLHYDDKYWGVPFYPNTGLLYYRTDLVDQPTSWQGLYANGEENPANGFLYQAEQSEGLTISFLEILYSAGGEILDTDGNVAVDNATTTEVLQFMQDGLADGASPRSVVTYNEDATRLAFEAGSGATMRNYPFAYAAGQQSAIADKFAVAPLPAWDEDGVGIGVLGGSNVAVSAFSENPSAALALIDFMTSEDWQEQIAINNSLAPAVTAAYEAPEVQEALPFSQELYTALQSAKSRPVTPVYPQVSQAIYQTVGEVLSGDLTPEDATTQMAERIQEALDTF
ncbi:ABC transporter substrate-binding protein [Microbacterium sp. bgisy207]|uniref:ABC transporter substrate-binding protein n=1 Tax=Microbacterium sp. bgisy207 TaxID=3413800 RepID=UPI003EBA488C